MSGMCAVRKAVGTAVRGRLKAAGASPAPLLSIVPVQANAGSMGARSDVEMQHTDFIHNQHARTRQVMEEQDENIDQLDGAVDRIHHMAEEIHGELKT
jgi:hypothetical protein